MSTFKRYDEEFKQSLVNLYQTGKTQSELCKDYGVSASALAKWIKQYSQVKLEDNSVLTAKQIQELQKPNAQLEEENLILKCHIHARLKVRLLAVYRLRFEHATTTLCRVLRVNRSTYYKFLKHKPSKRELDNQIYRKQILEIYTKANKRLGVKSIKVILQRDYDTKISEGRIYRLMKNMALPKMATVKPKTALKKTQKLILNTYSTRNFILTNIIKYGLLTSPIFLLDIRNMSISAQYLISILENVLLGN